MSILVATAGILAMSSIVLVMTQKEPKKVKIKAKNKKR